MIDLDVIYNVLLMLACKYAAARARNVSLSTAEGRRATHVCAVRGK